jgi:hypothetical protein
MLRISLDIDDTLANFSEGYLQRFKKWPKCDWAITRNVNNILIHEREFWLGLPVLNTVDFQPRMYCSARVNNKKWTKKYLKDRGFPDAPLYQIPGYNLSKAGVLRGKCDVHIEDSVKNFIDLNQKGIPCLLLDNERNRNIDTPLRIHSLKLEEIESVYNLGKKLKLF